MIEKATGIILRTLPYSETSLIVRWLTPNLGRVSTIAKGARRPKSSFAGKLDLFIEANLMLSRSARSDLHTLREAVVTDFHLSLRDDIERLQMAAYAVALIEQTTELDTPLPEVYALLHGLLSHLASAPVRPRLVFAFELKLLDRLGLAPDGALLSADAGELLRVLTREEWAGISELTPQTAEVKALARFLQNFLIYHLGRIPKLRGTVLGRPAKRIAP